jgi:hypothetical protein
VRRHHRQGRPPHAGRGRLRPGVPPDLSAFRVALARRPAAWLVGVVVVSALARYALATRYEAPWIFVDELVYAELARSVADGAGFLVRDEPSERRAYLYPLLISPAYRLFASLPDAYAAVKLVNAVVMSLAAVPAYLLARRMVAAPAALAAAVLAVAVPSMVYTGAVMTENLAYPLVLAAVLALALALERPTLLRTLVLLALCALAFLTRPQAVALVAAAALAPGVLALVRGRLAELRPFAGHYGLLTAAGLSVVAVQLARGESPPALVGDYAFAGEGEYSAGSVAEWTLYHVAELDLSVGVIPFAAFLLLLAVSRGLAPREQAFVAAVAATALVFVFQVGAFVSGQPWLERVQGRNTFYVAPLLLVAFVAWLSGGLPRPRAAALAAAVAAAALPPLLLLGGVLDRSVVAEAPPLVPWLMIRDRLGSGAAVAGVAAAASVAALLAFGLPRRLAPLLPAAVALYFALVLVPIDAYVRSDARGALWAATAWQGDPDWVDRAVGRDTEVAVLWSGRTLQTTVWVSEFFNRSVRTVYALADPLPGALPEPAAAIDEAGGALRDPAGRPVHAPFVLADRSVALAAPVEARAPGGELALHRTEGAVRVEALLSGRIPNSTWFGPRAEYRRFDCDGGELILAATGAPGASGQVLTASAATETRVPLAPGRPRIVAVPLRSDDGSCTVSLHVEPAAVDDALVPGAPGEPIGAQLAILGVDPR